MSEWVRLLVSIAVAGCAMEPARIPAPPASAPIAGTSVRESSVAPAPTCAPVPLGERVDAEDVLGRRLTAPLALYVEELGPRGIHCELRTLTPNPSGADFSARLATPASYYLQAGMIQQHQILLDRYALHGYSPDSLLVDGSEWFFSNEACLAHAGRYPPALVESDPGHRFDSKELEAFFDRNRRRVYRSGSVSAELLPSRPDFWYALSTGSAYYGRVYWNAPVAWLEGPLEPAPAGERFAGVYPLAFGPDYLEIGGMRLSESPPPNDAAGPPAAAVLPGNADRCGVVDFADDFWRHEAVYFLPLRDTSGVRCQEVRLSGKSALSFLAFGKEYEVTLRREREGFVFAIERPPPADPRTLVPTTDIVPGGESHRAVVHGGGDDHFMVDGSPWFFSQAACEAHAPGAKPVNFRDFRRGELRLAAAYYALDESAHSRECRKIELENVNEATGRATIHGRAGSEQRVFDVYGEGGLAFWIGSPLDGTLDVEHKFRGRLVEAARIPGGLRVGESTWYESEAACKAKARVMVYRRASAPAAN